VGSSGTATVDASSWSAGLLTIGQAGTGSVSVLDGGVVTAANTSIGAAGTLVASGALLSSPGTVVATGVTMSGGTLDVSGGGIVVISASAATGPTGTMLVDNASQFTGLGQLHGNVVLNNQGTLLATGVAPGPLVLTITGNITGGGTLEPLMTLDLNGAVGPAVQIVFHDPTVLEPGVLILEDATTEDGTISGFAEGNEIEIPGGNFTTAQFNRGTLGAPGTLILSGGTDAPLSLLVAGNYGVNDFSATSDALATTVTLVSCFVTGTKIATGDGEAPVEHLVPGMSVWTRSAGLAPVTWVGHRQVNCYDHPAPASVWPVRVSAGAFGPELPRRDLWLSPDHAVFVDGVLIPVKHLINRTTVVQIPRDDVTYYHVEVARHDVLLAEGLTVESYLDPGDRRGFTHAGNGVILNATASARAWEQAGCAALVQSGPVLAAVRERMAERSDAVACARTSAMRIKTLINA
jgi:T5SS/PEP-CTERM-associated repeat protein